MLKTMLVVWLAFTAHVALAEECARSVIANLYSELEAIDVAGEQRLGLALNELSKREAWTEEQKNDYTLSIAERPEVDAAESERTEFLGQLFTTAQRNSGDCAKIQELRGSILRLEEQQWEHALRRVEQRLAQ
ncbi:MAG: hypothetical protein ACI9BW_001723 [Gammaproteobacteria bacterium]|jgi:hypothetical protein